jgi:hypothetical protein
MMEYLEGRHYRSAVLDADMDSEYMDVRRQRIASRSVRHVVG